jgi:hypothetical protein
MTKQRSDNSSAQSTRQPKASGTTDSGTNANTRSEPNQKPQQMGEGSYEATRDYQKNIGEYLKRADVEKDAKAAKPRNDEEARQMQRAEEEGRSHSKAGNKTEPRE